jgi:pimeloyl-ACP methyl ester carboxylesterase
MNLLRQAVGAPRLNYIGLSYGTGLGAIYANLFPATTGRMVFDGNLNPVAWTSGGPLPGGMRQGQDLAIAATLRSFLDLCGKASPTACAFSAGTPAATRAKFATLLDRLLRHPVTIGNPPQAFTYADTLTSIPLGAESQWQQGAALLQQLWAASAAGSAASKHGSAATWAGAVYTGQEQLYAVTCPDESNPHGVSDYVAAARLAEARAGGYGLFDVWNEEPCADWPGTSVQDRYTGPWNRPTASTILLIGNTGDPATPYQSSVAMSRDLARARLLTVREFGHTEFFNPDTCATNDEVSYMTTGALPPVGTVCPPDGTPFPAPSS